MPGSSYYELVNDAVHMYIVSKYMYYCRLFGSGFIIQNLAATLYHLQNRTNRTAVTVHPEKNVKASEDYLRLMLHAHVIAAAKCLMSQRDFNDIRDLAVAMWILTVCLCLNLMMVLFQKHVQMECNYMHLRS